MQSDVNIACKELGPKRSSLAWQMSLTILHEVSGQLRGESDSQRARHMASSPLRCMSMTRSGPLSISRMRMELSTSHMACVLPCTHEQPASAMQLCSVFLLQFLRTSIRLTKWLSPTRSSMSWCSSMPHSPLPCPAHWHIGAINRHFRGDRPMHFLKRWALATCALLTRHSSEMMREHALSTNFSLVSDAMSWLLLTTQPSRAL
mmetsp:Transcript_59295/g.138118  ORF Transcript_59295/g.138118 Transcript_59295/m.138118 type:complete len:204 (-) Transcript_59295:523-1134(-)